MSGNRGEAGVFLRGGVLEGRKCSWRGGGGRGEERGMGAAGLGTAGGVAPRWGALLGPHVGHPAVCGRTFGVLISIGGPVGFSVGSDNN